MQLQKPFVFAVLALLSSAVLASGSGTLNDQTLSLDYSGGPYYAPLPLTEVAAVAGSTPPCLIANNESPLCDFYYFKVDLTDELRNAEGSAKARIDIVLTSAGEYDFFLYDSAGNLVAEPDHVEVPEKLSLPLKSLPNGDYALQIVPWMATAETFDLSVAVVGTQVARSGGLQGAFGGALNLMLLAPLLLAALRRRQRRLR